MPLRREVGNILDAETDALLVAVDGDHPRPVGGIARRLQERLDDARAWERIVREARFPIPAGAARAVSLEGASEVDFAYVLFACMFSHQNPDLSLASAYRSALAQVERLGLSSVATALYSGGWRGTPEEGMSALIQASNQVPGIEVVLYELPPRPFCASGPFGG